MEEDERELVQRAERNAKDDLVRFLTQNCHPTFLRKCLPAVAEALGASIPDADAGRDVLPILAELASLASDVKRIADVLAPAPSDIVGSPYVADRLGCTTVWIADLARNGGIPRSCLVPGTGNGKPWKFYRSRIDQWIEAR